MTVSFFHGGLTYQLKHQTRMSLARHLRHECLHLFVFSLLYFSSNLLLCWIMKLFVRVRCWIICISPLYPSASGPIATSLRPSGSHFFPTQSVVFRLPLMLQMHLENKPSEGTWQTQGDENGCIKGQLPD